MALKRLVRYLVLKPRVVWCFNWADETNEATIFVDTDFAGCRRTRRSTSGGIILMGSHPLRHWATTQPTIALSSGEAELVGIVRGATQALGFQSMAKDLGINITLHIRTDATAAIGICRRRGLGKKRHLHTADLWVQDRLRSRDFKISKVLGTENPSDILTKHVVRRCLEKHLKSLSIIEDYGRASLAPTIEHT